MRTLVIYVFAPLLLLLIVVGLLFFQKQPGRPDIDKVGKAAVENHLAQARAALKKSADLPTCRGAVQQLNSHLNATRVKAEPPSVALKAILQGELKLPEDDLNEVANPMFTPLDAHHLEACFLLRDVARSLDLAGPAARRKGDEKAAVVQLDPLKRAKVAFEWVTRQVRLQEPPEGVPVDEVPTPPALALRRGAGTALERALVFLALLEQFSLDDDDKSGLQGVLLYVPATDKGKDRFWACGVTVGNKPTAVYLFDPRLGLPLPGPGGKDSIATLAEAATRPEVLGQLQADVPPMAEKAKADKPEVKKLVYDVTPEQAKQAAVYLAPPLSALAPRMLMLQEKLLREQGEGMTEPIRVRLSEDPEATRARLQGLTDGKIQLRPEAVTHLRRFLPREEGGNDTGVPFALFQLPGFAAPNEAGGRGDFPRKQLFELRAVPWEDFPAQLRALRYDLGLGRHLRERFMSPFLRALNDPASARQLALRGKLDGAVKELILERDNWAGVRARADEARAGQGPESLADWIKKANSAYAAVLKDNPTIDDATLRARVAAVWTQGHAIEMTIGGAIATPREAQTRYQLALCKHEQAVRLQVRYDLADLGKAAQPEAASKLARAWESAENYWRDYIDTNEERTVAVEGGEVTLPPRPEVAAARRLRAEALHRYTAVMDGRRARKWLGKDELKSEPETRKANLTDATRLLRETAPGQTPLERLAHLLLARQLP